MNGGGAAGYLRRVRLLGVPTELMMGNLRHLDDLVHELHIVQAGVQSGQAELGPRLAALMGEILEAYSPARDAVRDQAEAAQGQGRPVVDIEVDLPPEAATAVPRLVDLLEQADAMCREQQLLTMAAPPEVAEMRRWTADQVVAQVARGEAPAPYPS